MLKEPELVYATVFAISQAILIYACYRLLVSAKERSDMDMTPTLGNIECNMCMYNVYIVVCITPTMLWYNYSKDADVSKYHAHHHHARFSQSAARSLLRPPENVPFHQLHSA